MQRRCPLPSCLSVLTHANWRCAWPCAGQTTCVDCPAGRAREHPFGAPATAATTCNACAAGSITVNPVVGASACTVCTAGTRQVGNTCPPCTGNTVSAAGQTNCTLCALGTISTSSFRTCTACPLGRFHADVSNTTCTDAPEGTYVDTEGVSALARVRVRFLSLARWACTEPIPVGTTTRMARLLPPAVLWCQLVH